MRVGSGSAAAGKKVVPDDDYGHFRVGAARWLVRRRRRGRLRRKSAAAGVIERMTVA